MSVHSDFILAPVSNILCDTSTITQSMSWGIEMYPLWDNIMQSIFMKMTGAQEQKMKCICWEIATIDFDLRRDIYFSWNLNECSQITDKRKVLNFLRRAILKQKKDFNFSTIGINDIWNSTKDILDEFHANTYNMGFCEREYQEYAEIFNSIGGSCLDISLFLRTVVIAHTTEILISRLHAQLEKDYMKCITAYIFIETGVRITLLRTNKTDLL